MAKFGELKKRDNGYWYVNLSKGKRLSTFRKKRSEAEIIRQEMVRKHERQGSCRQLLEEYSEDFYLIDRCRWVKTSRKNKKKKLGDAWIEARRGHLNNWLLPTFGDWPLNEFTASNIECEFDNFEISNTYRNKILESLKIILHYASKDSLIPQNPITTELRYPVNEEKIPDAFEPEDYKKLFPKNQLKLLSIWGNWESMLLFATLAYTGLRPGEARALKWDDILDGAFMIDKAVNASKEIGDTKTSKGVRAVPIVPELQWFLGQTERDTEFIFPSFTTSERNKYGRCFNSALKMAKICRDDRHLVPYSFRHSYNTFILEEVGVAVCQDLMGHADAKMTLRYTHIKNEAKPRRATVHTGALQRALSF